MSAAGSIATKIDHSITSAYPPRAEVQRTSLMVRLVPTTDSAISPMIEVLLRFRLTLEFSRKISKLGERPCGS
jgi:hypothetical protein